MTNPTPHGQVPEALIDLIDTYAETRHRCGGIYNAKTEAARKAVIEALSGVQALSAAPAIGDELRDTLVAVSAAIAEREDRAAQKMICEILAASTTPPAEQQAQPGAVYAELPQPDSWFHFTAQFWENKLRDFADRTHALRMQAAPKAAPGVGNSGFDHQTAADLLSGKTVSDETVRKFVQASRWAHDERAALSATLLAMHGVLTSREAEIALLKKALLEAEAAPQQEAQEPCPTCAALARTVMLDQVSFDRKPDCYGIRQITDDEGVEEWEDIRTSPDVAREEANDMMATGRGEIYEVVPLWTTPQPAPAPLSDDVVKDAARYRWLIDQHWIQTEVDWRLISTHQDSTIRQLDAAIDAALAAQGGKA